MCGNLTVVRTTAAANAARRLGVSLARPMHRRTARYTMPSPRLLTEQPFSQPFSPANRVSLEVLLGWMGTAKENFPALNDAVIPADQILEISSLIDRMQRVGVALAEERQLLLETTLRAA